MGLHLHAPWPLVGTVRQSRLGQFSQRSLLTSTGVQRGTIAITGATSATATITAITDLNNADLRFNGHTAAPGSVGNNSFARLALTNATTVTANVNTSPGANTVNVAFEVRERVPGVFKSPAQRGTIAGPGTATITAVVVAQASCTYLGFTSGAGAATDSQPVTMALTNATTVTLAAQDTTQTGGFQVVEEY